jgi:NTE family protein
MAKQARKSARPVRSRRRAKSSTPTETTGERRTPRRALVLSTGGAYGAFEVGVLEELIVRRGLDFEILCGISAGTLNASLLAQAQFDSSNPANSLLNLQNAFSTLRTLWLDQITGSESIYCPRLLGIGGIAVGADSVYDVTPLEDKIRQFANPTQIALSGRRLRIQYTVLETGELVTVTESGTDIVKGILASASIPVFFPPVVLNGQHLVDGGVRQMTPLSTAFDTEPPPDIIYVVYAQPSKLAPVTYMDSGTGFGVGALTYLMRTIAILLNQIDLTDVAVALKLNELKRQWETLRPQLPDNDTAVQAIDAVLGPKRYAKIIEIRPTHALSGDGLNFVPSEIRANYEYGRASAIMLPAEDTLEDSYRSAF